MKKLLIGLSLFILAFTFVGCGSTTDPNTAAYKERLVKSDWKFDLLGAVFRFNEDDTGEITLPGLSGKVMSFKYEISDATENGDSATLTIIPQETEETGELPSSTPDNMVYKTKFVAGGLQVDYNGNQTIWTPQDKS